MYACVYVYIYVYVFTDVLTHGNVYLLLNIKTTRAQCSRQPARKPKLEVTAASLSVSLFGRTSRLLKKKNLLASPGQVIDH